MFQKNSTKFQSFLFFLHQLKNTKTKKALGYKTAIFIQIKRNKRKCFLSKLFMG